MALTNYFEVIKWDSAALSKTLSTDAMFESNEVLFDSSDVQCDVQVSADNQGTPASGDVLNVYVMYTNGDITGGGGANTYDSYDATNKDGGHCMSLMVLDTYATNSPGEDPAVKTLTIPKMGKGFKLLIRGPLAASRNLLVRASRLMTRAS